MKIMIFAFHFVKDLSTFAYRQSLGATKNDFLIAFQGGAKSLQICAPMPGSEMGRSPNRAHKTPLARQYGSEIPIKYFGNKYN